MFCTNLFGLPSSINETSVNKFIRSNSFYPVCFLDSFCCLQFSYLMFSLYLSCQGLAVQVVSNIYLPYYYIYYLVPFAPTIIKNCRWRICNNSYKPRKAINCETYACSQLEILEIVYTPVM